MYHFADHHRDYHHHLAATEVGRLYWARMLTALANGLIAIFVPIYFLKLGYDVSQVFLYFALFGVFNIVTVYGSMRLLIRIGANHMMAFSNVLQIIFMVLLITLPDTHLHLAVPALVWALTNCTYWPAFHSNFSKVRNAKVPGRQISKMHSVALLSAIIAPALGGVIAGAYGIEYTYWLAVVVFLLASIPLLTGKEVITEKAVGFRSLSFQKVRQDYVANAGNAISCGVDGVIWPLLVFVIVGSYARVGIYSSVLILGSIITALYVGRRQELKGTRHYLKEGSLTLAVNNVFRLFASSSGHVLGLNLIAGLGNQLAQTPFATTYYKHANEQPRLAYVMSMEIAFFSGWAIIFMVIYLLSLVLDQNQALLVGVLLGAPASLLMRKIVSQS